MRKKIKKFIRFCVFLGIAVLGFILGSNYWIKENAKKNLYTQVNQVPKRKVGMVLGTSKRTVGGNVNLYFRYRMEAAAELYNNNKIEYIIVSGDNSVKYYNETQDMKDYLMELGVPENRIVQDYAGFRTLDSVVRTKEVFGQDSIIIISQKFHNERALFIADKNGINAIGFNAKDVSKNYGFKTNLREYLARVKCVLDIYILNTKPKFYKDKEIFPTDTIKN